MQAFLATVHDEMVDVITTGPLVPMKVNPEYAANNDLPRMVIKEKEIWNENDRKRANQDIYLQEHFLSSDG